MVERSPVPKPPARWPAIASVGILAGVLCVLGIFARTKLTAFQKMEGRLLLSGSPQQRHYEMWTVTLPSRVSVLLTLAATGWICWKVLRNKWPKAWLALAVAYLAAFLFFQFFLVGLGFEAFD